MNTRHRWVRLSIAAAALPFAVGCGSSTTTVTKPQPVAHPVATQVRIFTAVSAATGSPTIHISSRPRGYCWTTSDSILRSNAWRCFVGNFIHDPCFSGIEGAVVCPTGGPWTGSGIEIKLTRPLPASSAKSQAGGPSGPPWALQLADGSKCRYIEGAASTVDGLRFNYTCAPDKLDLYGEPQRRSALWTIYASPANTSQRTTVPVAIAWY